MSRLIATMTATMALVTLAGATQAEALQVDIESNASTPTTEDGWVSWVTDKNDNTASISIAYGDTVGGTLDAGLSATTDAGSDNRGITYITDPGNLANTNMWKDYWFTRSGGDITLTLEHLKAGTYQFASYHYGDNLNSTYQAEADVVINSQDTGFNVTTVTADSSSSTDSAELTSIATFAYLFEVANDNDTVTILYDRISGSRLGINGFELTKVETNQAYATIEDEVTAGGYIVKSDSASAGSVGDLTVGTSSGGDFWDAVLTFQLPDLGGLEFRAAEFAFEISTKSGSAPISDLAGLRVSSANTVAPSDHQAAGAAVLVDTILDPSTSYAGGVVQTRFGETALNEWLGNNYAAGDFAVMAVRAQSSPGGNGNRWLLDATTFRLNILAVDNGPIPPAGTMVTIR